MKISSIIKDKRNIPKFDMFLTEHGLTPINTEGPSNIVVCRIIEKFSNMPELVLEPFWSYTPAQKEELIAVFNAIHSMKRTEQRDAIVFFVSKLLLGDNFQQMTQQVQQAQQAPKTDETVILPNGKLTRIGWVSDAGETKTFKFLSDDKEYGDEELELYYEYDENGKLTGVYGEYNSPEYTNYPTTFNGEDITTTVLNIDEYNSIYGNPSLSETEEESDFPYKLTPIAINIAHSLQFSEVFEDWINSDEDYYPFGKSFDDINFPNVVPGVTVAVVTDELSVINLWAKFLSEIISVNPGNEVMDLLDSLTSTLNTLYHKCAEDIASDYQFDPNDDNYMGFLNMSPVDGDMEDYPMVWETIVDHQDIFETILNHYGKTIGTLTYDDNGIGEFIVDEMDPAEGETISSNQNDNEVLVVLVLNEVNRHLGVYDTSEGFISFASFPDEIEKICDFEDLDKFKESVRKIIIDWKEGGNMGDENFCFIGDIYVKTENNEFMVSSVWLNKDEDDDSVVADVQDTGKVIFTEYSNDPGNYFINTITPSETISRMNLQGTDTHNYVDRLPEEFPKMIELVGLSIGGEIHRSYVAYEEDGNLSVGIRIVGMHVDGFEIDDSEDDEIVCFKYFTLEPHEQMEFQWVDVVPMHLDVVWGTNSNGELNVEVITNLSTVEVNYVWPSNGTDSNSNLASVFLNEMRSKVDEEISRNGGDLTAMDAYLDSVGVYGKPSRVISIYYPTNEDLELLNLIWKGYETGEDTLIDTACYLGDLYLGIKESSVFGATSVWVNDDYSVTYEKVSLTSLVDGEIEVIIPGEVSERVFGDVMVVESFKETPIYSKLLEVFNSTSEHSLFKNHLDFNNYLANTDLDLTVVVDKEMFKCYRDMNSGSWYYKVGDVWVYATPMYEGENGIFIDMTDANGEPVYSERYGMPRLVTPDNFHLFIKEYKDIVAKEILEAKGIDAAQNVLKFQQTPDNKILVTIESTGKLMCTMSFMALNNTDYNIWIETPEGNGERFDLNPESSGGASWGIEPQGFDSSKKPLQYEDRTFFTGVLAYFANVLDLEAELIETSNDKGLSELAENAKDILETNIEGANFVIATGTHGNVQNGDGTEVVDLLRTFLENEINEVGEVYWIENIQNRVINAVKVYFDESKNLIFDDFEKTIYSWNDDMDIIVNKHGVVEMNVSLEGLNIYDQNGPDPLVNSALDAIRMLFGE